VQPFFSFKNEVLENISKQIFGSRQDTQLGRIKGNFKLFMCRTARKQKEQQSKR
jgi:hypothetical protein